MKNATQCAKQLTALLVENAADEAAALPDEDDPIATLVLSFLMWEAPTGKAVAAYERLRQHVVDFNDLRVCMPHEIAGYVGTRYPMVEERCQRLRAVLRNIYLREHAVSLDSLADARKREVKKHLESLEGMVPYVAARVMLLCFDTHAIPIDERLRAELVAAGAADEDADVSAVGAWLARQIRAGDGRAAHAALQRWVDGAAARTRRTRGKKTTARKPAGAAPTRKGSSAAKKADRGADAAS